MTDPTEAVLAELRDERARQKGVHGQSAEKDDERPLAHFAYLLARRAVELAHPWPDLAGINPRRLLIEIASIAVATVESIDRKARQS